VKTSFTPSVEMMDEYKYWVVGDVTTGAGSGRPSVTTQEVFAMYKSIRPAALTVANGKHAYPWHNAETKNIQVVVVARQTVGTKKPTDHEYAIIATYSMERCVFIARKVESATPTVQ